LENEIECSCGSNRNADDSPPPETFDDSHPDQQENKSGKEESQFSNNNGIKEKDDYPQKRPEPGPLGPKGYGGFGFSPIGKDQ
jgi:hypothetical protein